MLAKYIVDWLATLSSTLSHAVLRRAWVNLRITFTSISVASLFRPGRGHGGECADSGERGRQAKTACSCAAGRCWAGDGPPGRSGRSRKQTGSSNCHSEGAGLDLKPHLCDSVSGVSFLFDCGRGFGAKLVVPNSASNRQPEARSPRPQFAGRRVALTIRYCLDGWAWSGDPSVFGPGVP